MTELPDVPESCERGDHDWDQTMRCRDCNYDKNADLSSRRSGGAGSLTSPLSDEDYRREMDKLTRMGGE